MRNFFYGVGKNSYKFKISNITMRMQTCETHARKDETKLRVAI